MSPVSPTLSRELDALSEQIRVAEEFLRKQPGATEVSTTIGEREVLEFVIDEKFDGRLIVTSFDMNGNAHRLTVSELPVSRRIEVALEIPDLIESQDEREAAIVEKVQEASSQIQQAIAEVSRAV